ncbi:MAG: hypothetical protein ACI8X5_002785, partial [Planctomycetota bacterium]
MDAIRLTRNEGNHVADRQAARKGAVGASLLFAFALGSQAHGASTITLDSSSCPGPQTYTVSACFPSDCDSLRFADDCGGGGAPEAVLVPKFNPLFGQLVGVDIVISVRSAGQACGDQTFGSCGSQAIFTVNAFSTFEAASPLPGLGVMSASTHFEDLQVLGANDGIDDCGPYVPGTCGTSSPPSDHALFTWDQEQASPPVHVSGISQLSPWINPLGLPQESITFNYSSSSCLGLFGPLSQWSNMTLESASIEVTYTFCPIQPATTAYCFGDGTQGLCPCGAIGAFGQGCPNTNPNQRGAKLQASGSPEVGNDTFNLVISDGAFNRPGIIIQGATPLNYPNGNGSVPNASGLFCVAPQQRGTVFFMDGSGNAVVSDFQGAPFGSSAQPCGSTTYYQHWFRDPESACQNA